MMELWMSSLPGRRPGSKLFRQNRKPATMSSQVTLHLDVEPPVLSISEPKPPPTKNVNQGSNTRKTGKFWHSLRSVYQSFCAGSTPVTWVNPEMMNPHPVTYNHLYLPEGQYLAMEAERNMNVGGCPWYPATADVSQLHCIDPLQVWPQKMVFPSEAVPQARPYFTNYPSKISRFNQPLNPEAKEWIPKELREKKESMPCSQNQSSSPLKDSSYMPASQNYSNVSVCQDFSEITESEIDAVRNGTNAVTCSLSPVSKKKQIAPDISTGKIDGDKSVKTTDSDVSHTLQCIDEKTNETIPVSYAGAAKKVLSSPEPSSEKSSEQPHLEGVEQKLPKIFLKDKKYPKEKAPLLMEKNDRKLPFKTANRVQKKNGRKFLNELKASAHTESDCGSLGSEASFGSPSSDGIPHSISPRCIPNSCDSPTSERLSGVCATPEARSPMMQRTVSESSSNASRMRSNSESSVASIDSINIEFEDELDKGNSVSNVCIIGEKCLPKCADSTKLSNSVALILGLGDCKSEDSDIDWDDSDSDWDEVEADSMFDDSWETFGMGLTITSTCKPSSSQKCEGKESNIISNLQFEQNCDTVDNEDDTFECNLEAINKHWKEEIGKDISPKTENRVRFGDITVRPMVTWAYAYQQARRGPWEQYARDTARFSRHISDLEAIISPVLQENHRRQIYQKLYGESSES